MRCALIVPPWRPGDIFPEGTVGSQLNYWQPLGVLYIAAALRVAGHDVRFLDGSFLDEESIAADLDRWQPGWVGLTATTFSWPRAVSLARRLKALKPAPFICAGGPYAIALRHRCLEETDVPIDAVVTGEGEAVAPVLVDRLAKGIPLDGLAGVDFRRDGAVVANPPAPLIEDLDGLPFPARDLLGERARYVPAPATYRRRPVATMLTSRGCNRRCLYCFQIDRDRSGGHHGVRLRSVANVMAEIEACLAEGYREIKFLDDSFVADYDRAFAIAREIRARRLDFTWFASACVNQVDEPLLREMRLAGCWAILLGAESGVQRNLNTLRKGITLEQTRAAVRAAKRVGLQVSTPFVFGIPGESVADIERTIEFAIELDPDLANFHALTPFPGTPLHERARDLGWLSTDHNDYTYQGVAFVPTGLQRDDIIALRRLAFRRFYSRPRWLLRRLMRLRRLDDLWAAVLGAISLVNLWNRPAATRR
jgi:radical SAM superfamily enzyme YgiQ (UPF0313 family)